MQERNTIENQRKRAVLIPQPNRNSSEKQRERPTNYLFKKHSMANLPYIVKLFSSCFAGNENPLCRQRNVRTHGPTCQSRADSFSSSSDSESVVLGSTSSTMSWCQCSEDECNSNRGAKQLTVVRPNQRKRLREDSLHLCNTLSVTDQEASCFANLTARDGEEPKRKSHHVLSDERRDVPISGHLVVSAKTKATLALLRKELNYVKSQLNIAQARCELLQDENRWLRANMQAEEDSLLQCEVELLLASKSQLAQDNANLRREREILLQLVEYLQKGFTY